MEKKDYKRFRTYKRRPVTRVSGNKVSGVTTGGEAIVKSSQKMVMEDYHSQIVVSIDEIELSSLFEQEQGLIAFAGYIYPSSPVNLDLIIEYTDFSGNSVIEQKEFSTLKENDWNSIGLHVKQRVDVLNEDYKLHDVRATIDIGGKPGTILNFCSIDFASVDYEDYLSEQFHLPFTQRTNMHVPHIYYLETTKTFKDFNTSYYNLRSLEQPGEPVVLKSCNRCTRFLPVNIKNELNTLSFSLHCKKNAPCNHTTFSKYNIDYDHSDNEAIEALKNDSIIEDDYVISYYGHQLECKSCKKFYVNHALNPLRNPQQFKEDGLRRRALEVLTNILLDRKLIHHEFEHKTKTEFSTHIWDKFGRRCFKCSKNLELKEMHLDHTLPLAYLYRLDETATCLCARHNSQKSDSFPVNFYSNSELEELSNITGLSLEDLTTTSPNMVVVNELVDNVTWFFDNFLMNKDYQKVRDGIKTADKIYQSLVKILPNNINLLTEYYNIKNKYPDSITVIKN